MATTDRALIEIVTAFNATGIKEAQTGFLGMSSSLTAVVAGLGILAVATKSIVDITEQHDAAENSLAQAIKESGGNIDKANTFLTTFIETNRAYIPEQAAVIQGYADLTRSGLSQTETQLDLNRALDIAALKHISLEAAVQLLIAAEHGRTRGLIDLGITTTKYTDAQGNVINQGKNMALVMKEIDDKTAHGRETTLETTQATNKLSEDWQDIANNVGPPLVQMLDGILQGVDFLVQKLKELGNNKDWANAVNAALYFAFQEPLTGIISDVQTAYGWLRQLIVLADQVPGVHISLPPLGGQGGSVSGGGRAGGIQSFQEGGVLPYTGLFLGHQGETVTPVGSSPGHNINISIETYVGDASTLSKMLAHELRLTGAFK